MGFRVCRRLQMGFRVCRRLQVGFRVCRWLQVGFRVCKHTAGRVQCLQTDCRLDVKFAGNVVVVVGGWGK
jgi:hypothetical protein